MTIGLFVDVALVGLVATMIGYCVMLDRRLARLREGQAEMIRVAAAFQEAIGRAEAALAGFHAVGRASGERLDRLVGEARALGDELTFLAERGERSAARLAGEGHAASGSGLSRVEHDLADALRAAR
jgi:hypothetical protein